MDWFQPKDLLASFLLDLLQVWLFSLYFQLHIHKMRWDFLFLFSSVVICEVTVCVCTCTSMCWVCSCTQVPQRASGGQRTTLSDSSHLPPVLEIAPLVMFTVVFKLASPQASGDSPVSIACLQRGACWDYRCLGCRVLEIMA